MIDIKKLRRFIQRNHYEISLHAQKERYAENISIIDIERAISNGEIIEDYPEDKRGASCLILGYSGNKAIHIVCSATADSWPRIITVYIPKMPKWLTAKQRRR